MSKQIIVVAGATGNLGGRIVKALLANGAEVRAMVRAGTSIEKKDQLSQMGATVLEVNMAHAKNIAEACRGAGCVVSALAGLGNVIIDAQKILLYGAVAAGVPRFIPSDYSLDFTNFQPGENRNLDLRREFHKYLDAANISSTTIFNGAFMDMLTDEIPMIIFKRRLVLYWGNAGHKISFTTMDDTANFTAHVAMDKTSPRYLRISGDRVSPREIREIMNELTGKHFRLIRTGGLGLLSFIIKVARMIAPGKKDLYPAWQGMQYMRNMMDKRAGLNNADNGRYQDIKFTTVKELIARVC